LDYLGRIESHIRASIETKRLILENRQLLESIKKVTEEVVRVYQNNGKVIIAGNGGSAADSQHIAAEFVSRFNFDRPGLPAIALTTDSSMLTAIGNDYGFEKLFRRQLEAMGNKGDIFIGISTSGNSANVLEAIEAAREKGVTTVALCGSTGRLGSLCDYAIEVPSDSTPFIQESHIMIGHIICGLVELELFGK
jgi:D-sedoheptulose 7-phosphate isomerase|tara:strand:+ start:549 stop:1130 length:582 start_codon:yes stop_codon:yes gene_type:complete